jgi:hypothetical protein
LESRGFRGRRASLRNYARLTPSGLLSVRLLCDRSPPRRRRRRNASPAR